MDDINSEKIEWANSVPIFKSSIIIKQLGIAVGIPFLLVIAFIISTSGLEQDTLYATGLILLTLLLTYLFLKTVYGGKYYAEFVVDNIGIKCSTQDKYRKRNHILNTITMLAGLSAKKPTISGVGWLAESKNSIFIPWKNISNVKYIDKEFVILVNGKLTQSIALFCNRENYSSVKDVIRGRIHD